MRWRQLLNFDRSAPSAVRHYGVLAGLVLALAAFNLTYRIGLESVGEWDESLYATSAWEMLQSGDMVGTTFDGQLDYSNSKPPLQVWILATSFRALGVNLIALRAFSVLCAWLTVLALLLWTRRAFDALTSLCAGLVLASTFGFLHLHAGRSGNPDALLTLLILLTAIVLWAGERRPWTRVWLGPILAGVFLLKGAAVLVPLVLILLVDLIAMSTSTRPRRTWLITGVASALFAIPAGAWIVARWRLDQWRFFDRMINGDLVALTLIPHDGRGGGPFFYLDVLQKHQYDWLVVAAVAAGLLYGGWRGWARRSWSALQARQHTAVLLAAWTVATLAIPTALQTKLFWYLDPFYPLFALGVGALVAAHLRNTAQHHWGRRACTAALVVAALVIAEGRSLWHLHRITNLSTSAQGLLLDRSSDFRGRRVWRDRLHRGEAFVVRAMLGGRFGVVDALDVAGADARSDGDLFLLSSPQNNPYLRLIGQADGFFLYEGTKEANPQGAGVKSSTIPLMQ